MYRKEVKKMKKLYGYNIYSRELQEAINDVKFGLEKYNFEYKSNRIFN